MFGRLFGRFRHRNATAAEPGQTTRQSAPSPEPPGQAAPVFLELLEATPLEDVTGILSQVFARAWNYVLFRHGTVVALVEPVNDPRQAAIDLLAREGPVHPGSTFGDFGVSTLNHGWGYIVTSHHQHIMTYVSPSQLAGQRPPDLFIGLNGRQMRQRDSAEREIVHLSTAG